MCRRYIPSLSPLYPPYDSARSKSVRYRGRTSRGQRAANWRRRRNRSSSLSESDRGGECRDGQKHSSVFLFQVPLKYSSLCISMYYGSSIILIWSLFMRVWLVAVLLWMRFFFFLGKMRSTVFYYWNSKITIWKGRLFCLISIYVVGTRWYPIL